MSLLRPWLLLALAAPWGCGSETDSPSTIVSLVGGSGGSSAGATSTGGAGTGSSGSSGQSGTAGSPTGGTGGQATGGQSTGGQSTGGQSTGGQSTGGQSTGGQSAGGQSGAAGSDPTGQGGAGSDPGGQSGAAGSDPTGQGGTAGSDQGGSAGTGGQGGDESGGSGPGGSPGGSSGASGAATSGPGGAPGAGAAGASGTAGAAGSGTSGQAGQSSLCDGVAQAKFDPPEVCDKASGNTTSEIPSNGVYATSWFGCYRKADGTIYKDPGDNCEFACGSKGLCPSGQSGPECEANLKWFAADADRYGCGARIRVTNCVNGKAVVLATLDRGPNCKSVEQKYKAPVLDMSHDAMVHLFDGKTYGGSDLKRVVIEKVDANTKLGPVEP